MLLAENRRSACCSRVVLSNCSLLAKQTFYFYSWSQKNRSPRHARECSQGPFVTPLSLSRSTITCDEPRPPKNVCVGGYWALGTRRKEKIIFCIKMCRISPFFSAFAAGFLGVPLYIFAHFHLHIYLACARFIGSMIARVFNT